MLGSGACFPSPARGASCMALRVRDSYWLFDVGEGTQVQLQRCAVRPGKIDKVFVTHAHGDHSFGLPGLLCLIARGRDRGAPPLEIYGPHGIRAFIRIALSFTNTRMLPPYVVHELHDIPMLGRGTRPAPRAISSRPVERANVDQEGIEWGEVCGSRDLQPLDERRWWQLLDSDGMRVRAVPVQHSVPCVGFIIEEVSGPAQAARRGLEPRSTPNSRPQTRSRPRLHPRSRPRPRPGEQTGRLLIEKVMPSLEANFDALRAQGVRDPRSLLKIIKDFEPDGEFVLPDGKVLAGRGLLGQLSPSHPTPSPNAHS